MGVRVGDGTGVDVAVGAGVGVVIAVGMGVAVSVGRDVGLGGVAAMPVADAINGVRVTSDDTAGSGSAHGKPPQATKATGARQQISHFRFVRMRRL